SFGQKSFAGTRRAYHEDALRDAAAEFLEFFRILQKLDQFRNFFDGFLDAGDIFKGDLVAVLGQQPGLALAKAQGAFAGDLDLSDEEKPEQDANAQEK